MNQFVYSQSGIIEGCKQILNGHVFNKVTMEPITGAAVSLIDESGKIIGYYITNQSGDFSFVLECNKNYSLLGRKESYREDIESFVTTNVSNQEQKVDLYLELVLVASYMPPEVMDYFFPWPPPIASAKISLSRELFKGCNTFSDVQFKLKNALEENGYEEIVYMGMLEDLSNPRKLNGFATVTKMEQINKNGSSKREKHRWSAKVSNDISSISDYIQALFFTRPGYFRVIVFVVVDEQFNSIQKASREDALEWLIRGSPFLEPELANSKFTENHEVISLIYEYRLNKNKEAALLSMPSELSGKKHLEKSKILGTLNKN
ncbi:hypothetical protein MWU50_08810 [Flavobacteriaceae bacterium S0862]|nr:hypothetical protein [Flavobacteriaceae bacterium S0862]